MSYVCERCSGYQQPDGEIEWIDTDQVALCEGCQRDMPRYECACCGDYHFDFESVSKRICYKCRDWNTLAKNLDEAYEYGDKAFRNNKELMEKIKKLEERYKQLDQQYHEMECRYEKELECRAIGHYDFWD